MARVDTYSCDQCGAQKTKANGWFRVYIKLRSMFIIQPWDETILEVEKINVSPTLIVAEEKHYCSESCVAKAFSKTMGSGILAASTDAT